MTRSRACPHPASRPEHPGQRNHPAASRRSTTPATTPTVTIGASAHPARPSRHLGQEKDGRAAANPDLITVASHTKKDNPAGLPSRPSSPQTTLTRRYVPPLDHARNNACRDHRCPRPPRAALPPPRPRERREGRRQPGPDHGGVAHEKGQPRRAALPAILTTNDANPSLRPAARPRPQQRLP